MLGEVAFVSLMDMPLAERLYGAAVDAAPQVYGQAHAWLAVVNEDRPEIARLIALDEGDLDERFAILSYLAGSSGIDRQPLVASFQQLIKRRPESWRYRYGLISCWRKTATKPRHAK